MDRNGGPARILSGTRARGAPGQTRLPISIESALGLRYAFELASASPRNLAVFMGGEDLSLDLGLPVTRSGAGFELVYPRSPVMIAAAAARVFSIDKACMEFKDLGVFRRHQGGIGNVM